MLSTLRKRKGAEMLVSLLKGPKGIRGIQIAVGGSYKTIYARLKEFSAQGLITERRIIGETTGRKQYSIRQIQLTEEGRRTAQSWVDSGIINPLELLRFRERWIIAILHVLGRVSGVTRFMKLLFLVKKELGFDTRRELAGFYRFTSWIYGPFSTEIMDDLESLHNDGFISIKGQTCSSEEFNEGYKTLYIYELASDSLKVVQEALEYLPPNVVQKLEKLKTFNRMPLKRLLEYVYLNYPDYIKKSEIVDKILSEQSRTR